jgi:hypothetical protein
MSEENVNRELGAEELEEMSGGAATDPFTADFAQSGIPEEQPPRPA